MSAPLLLAAGFIVAAFAAWPRPERAVLAIPAESDCPATQLVTEDSNEDVFAVASAIDLLVLALGSGAPIVSAVEAVAEQSGPIVRSQLRQVAAAMQWGIDDAAAWGGLPALWHPVGQAFALAHTSGVPPAGLLRRVARSIRDSEEHRLETAAARLSVLIVIPLGLCFLPAFVLLTIVPVVTALARDFMVGLR